MRFDRQQGIALSWSGVMLAVGAGGGILISHVVPATPADLLSFAGSLLGAALTIWGAVYLFEHQREQARQSARKVMKELLQQILDEAELVRRPRNDPAVENYIPAVMMITRATRVAENIDAVKQARTWFTPDTAKMVRAFARLDTLSINVDALRTDLRPAMIYGGIPNVDQHLNRLESRVKMAIAELDF